MQKSPNTEEKRMDPGLRHLTFEDDHNATPRTINKRRATQNGHNSEALQQEQQCKYEPGILPSLGWQPQTHSADNGEFHTPTRTHWLPRRVQPPTYPREAFETPPQKVCFGRSQDVCDGNAENTDSGKDTQIHEKEFVSGQKQHRFRTASGTKADGQLQEIARIQEHTSSTGFSLSWRCFSDAGGVCFSLKLAVFSFPEAPCFS